MKVSILRIAVPLALTCLLGCGETVLSLLDGDGDGVPASTDCDDRSPLWGDIANDQDCDTIVTAEDCDDNDPSRPLGDLDCDGVPIGEDCNDLSPFLFEITNDADCDGVLTADDCDDNDATLGVTADDGACEAFCTSGFIFVPPAQFTMGSPTEELGRDEDERQHLVQLSQGYCLQALEANYGNSTGESRPMPMSFRQALAYANEVSITEGLAPCYPPEPIPADFNPLACEGYRLPTEAEWEYAARSGSSLATYIGDLHDGGCHERVLGQIAWFCGNSGDLVDANNTYQLRGTLRASPAGFYDMLGNLSEWVWDAYAPYEEGVVIDPIGPAYDPGAPRIHRGGDYLGPGPFEEFGFGRSPCFRGVDTSESFDGGCARTVRAASRESVEAGTSNGRIGLRLARSRPTGTR